jgi:YQGE family putative transporter
MALSVLSAAIVIRGDFPTPRIGQIFYMRFNPLWWRMMLLSFLKGIAQGYILVMPAMLVLQLVGYEGTLGLIESVGGVVTAGMLYVVGRMTAPEDRSKVFAVGLVLFVVGSLANSLLFDVVGVLIFQFCLVLAKPLLDLAYWPIEMHAIEVSSRIDSRNRYAYLLHHELGLLHGRLTGCGLMIFIALEWSGLAALRYALPFVAFLQLLSIPVTAWLRRGERQKQVEWDIVVANSD